ncbi:ATP-binding protein [Cyclobacterium xiamenense]|uniref:ATP-binding protein n=1 Tax=Cyclobacterium xiamenense TaxID=1297121 RepID=UPI0012B83EEC|nr:ATP-binding protein [Cyclobacterium xiamenense]
MNKFFPLVFFLLCQYLVFGQTFKFNKQIRGLGETPNIIYSIAQDQKGFIWVATNQGVKFSDGIRSEFLPDSIRQTFTTEQNVFVDADGEVWVYQQSGRPLVYRHTGDSWQKAETLLTDSMATGNHDSMVFFSLGQGPKKELFLVLPDWVIHQKRSGEPSTALPTSGLGDFYSHFVSENDTLFLFERGVYRMSAGSFQREQQMDFWPEDEPLVKMARLPGSQSYFFLTRNRLYAGENPYSLSDTLYRITRDEPTGPKDRFDLFLKNEKVYFYYNSHLYQFNTKTRRRFVLSVYEELRVRQVNTAMVDREGIIWIGTFRGLANLASTKFQNFDEQTGAPAPDISAAILYGRQKYLVGFENGIQAWRGGSPAVTHFFSSEIVPDRRDRVLNFSLDNRGNVWFSAYDHGLGFFDAETMDMRLFSLPENQLVSYVWTDEEHLWVAGDQRVYRARLPAPGSSPDLNEYDIGLPPDKPIGFIRKIGRLKNGKWMILVAGGTVSSNELRVYPNAIKLQGYDFLERNDSLFVGTEKGFFSLEDTVLRPARIHGQTVDHPVYAFLEDEKGQLWLGTDSGVLLQESDRLRVFTEKTGLIGNDVGRGALAQADKGRILIGTQNGVSVYYPEEDQESLESPLVFLEKVAILDAKPIETEFLKIPFRLNNIVCSFSAASFRNAPDLTIYYWLEGLHTEWQALVNPHTNELLFNNLPPGDYRLALKAGLSGYPPSEVVYSDRFQIDLPFYLQFWFLLLLAAFLLALGYGISLLYRQAKNQGRMRNTLHQKTQEIANREDRFRNVWNSSQDGLLLSVKGGKVIAANPVLCEMASVTEKELQTYGVAHLFADPGFYPSIRDEISEDLAKIDNSGFTRELKMPFRGKTKEIELFISRMKEDFDGNPLYLNVFRDISTKKAFEQGLKHAKEKAEEVSQLKSSIISNMSHELRTPLNGILGSTEHLIQRRSEDKELLGHLDIIRESGERLLQTMTNILDLSQIEADRVDFVLEKTNINDFISKILVKHKSAGIKKGILVTSKFPTRPFFANVERKCLEIIVNNIVGNSIKYSEKGMVQVHVEKIEHQLALQVRDQGVGISEDYLVKLFYPFEQESKGFNRKFEGAGIGLAISKHLVERLDGTILLESEKGKGTLVKIFLPLDS